MLYIKVTQSHIHILFSHSSPLRFITGRCIQFPVLSSRSCRLSTVYILQFAFANPELLLHHPPPRGNHKSILYVWEAVCFLDKFICVLFWIPHISDIIWCLSFSFWLTSPLMIISSYKTFMHFYFFFPQKSEAGAVQFYPQSLLHRTALGPNTCASPSARQSGPAAPGKRRGRIAARSPSKRQSWTAGPVCHQPWARSELTGGPGSVQERPKGRRQGSPGPHLRWPRPTRSQPHLLLRDPEHALTHVISLQRGADLSDETVFAALQPEPEVSNFRDVEVVSRFLLLLCESKHNV